MSRIRRVGLLLALAFATGCFAFEEIDDGMARWSRNSERATSSDAAPEAPPPQRRHGWEQVRSLGSEPMTGDIADCILGGRSQYMRESECVARGGRVTP